MCNCNNIDFGSTENFAQQVEVPIPEHMKTYKDARLQNGQSPTVCIDPCIVDEVKELWRLGITTYGSCCGHNKAESFVNVGDSDVDRMLELGYIQNHSAIIRMDTFKLKSV